MQEKGNKVENWNDSYERLKVTYSERKNTPVELMNVIQFEFVNEDIEKYLPDPLKARILECGCGGARTSLYLARKGFDVTCSDNAPEALRLAEDNFAAYSARGSFLQDDLLNSKIPAESYDCVMSFGLLEHFEDLRPILTSITRMVKPGGIQIHCVITKKFSLLMLTNILLYPLRFLNNLVRLRWKRIFVVSYRDFPHYENTFSAEEYCREFSRAGNSILRCEAGAFLFPLLTLPIVGNMLAKAFHETLYRIIRTTDRTESKFWHFLAPTFYIVCRKQERP